MALAHFQRTFTDTAGNIRAGLSVEIRNESTGALAAIYEDKDGNTVKDNPFTTDSFGYGDFYAASGRYRIIATDVDWRNEDLVTFEALADAVNDAETAAQAAALNAGIYADTTEGLANTVDGEYFSIPSPDAENYLDLYRNDAGSAILIDSYPNRTRVDNLEDNLQAQIDDRVIRVSSRTEMKVYDVPAGYQFAFDGLLWDVKAGTPPSDPQEGLYVVLNNGNYAKRELQGLVSFAMFQISPDTGGSYSELSSEINSMLSLLEGMDIVVEGDGEYGIGASVIMPSNTTLRFKNVTLVDNGSWETNQAPNFNFGIIIRQANNTNIHGLVFDGNNSAYGGRTIAPPYDGSRGFIIWDGCYDCYYHDCKSINAQSNSFLSYSGGNDDSSDGTGFIRCTVDGSGIGIGQEIWTVRSVAGTANPGPQNVIYENCVVESSLVAMLLAGGTATVNGGYFEAEQQKALQGGPGDAAEAHLLTRYQINNAHFKQTGAVAVDNIVRMVSRPPASSLPTYGEETNCQIQLNNCTFEQVADNGAGVLFYQGCDAELNNCTFMGPGVLFRHLADTFQPDSNFYNGNVILNNPVFKGFGSTSGSPYSHGVAGDMPYTINGGQFYNPAQTNIDCIRLNNDSVVNLIGVKFGDEYQTTALRLAVNAAGVTIGKLLVENCQDAGLSTGYHNLSQAKAALSRFIANTPVSTLEVDNHHGLTAAPISGTWEQGNVVWNTQPSGGEPIGWVCVVSGTPGTWRSFGTISS